MTSVFFSKFAMQELDDATHFYEMEIEGLGQGFKDEVKKAVLRIADSRSVACRKWRHQKIHAP